MEMTKRDVRIVPPGDLKGSRALRKLRVQPHSKEFGRTAIADVAGMPDVLKVGADESVTLLCDADGEVPEPVSDSKAYENFLR